MATDEIADQQKVSQTEPNKSRPDDGVTASNADTEGAVPFAEWSVSPAAADNYANPAAAAPTC